MQPTPDLLNFYKSAMTQGEIPAAYRFLMGFMHGLKAQFEKAFAAQYQTGNLSPGYLDYTYFPFFDGYLRDNRLRFGIVLNHEKLRFELWLMGQNAVVQQAFWDLLKSSKWNKGVANMPRYAVLESILVADPDFEKPEMLTQKILAAAESTAAEIVAQLKRND